MTINGKTVLSDMNFNGFIIVSALSQTLSSQLANSGKHEVFILFYYHQNSCLF